LKDDNYIPLLLANILSSTSYVLRFNDFINAIVLGEDFSMLLYRIETALSFECGSILLTYNLSYSLEKNNKTSVKIRSFRMKIFTYIYVLEEALY